MLNREHLIQFLQWIILLALFAYDWFSYFPEESNFALLKSIYYVVIFACFAFIYMLKMQKGTVAYNSIGNIAFIIQLFIWLYFIRIYYDFMIANIEQAIVTNPFAAIFLYVNAAIMPFYGFLFFDWKLVNPQKLNFMIWCIFLLMGLFSLYEIIIGHNTDFIAYDGRFMGNSSMDPIGFGHVGTTIVITSIAMFYQNEQKVLLKCLYILSVVIGLFIITSSGSRGALVALFICLFFYIYICGHKKTLLFIFVTLTCLYLLLPQIADILYKYDNPALERISASIYNPNSMESGVTSGRNLLYIQALRNIHDHPIFGSPLFVNGEYVHNSVLESFLGLGIFGGLLYLVMIVYVLIKALKLAAEDKRYLFVSLLFIQYVAYSMFSRTLSILPIFWLSMYLVIYINATKNESVCDHTLL